MDFGRLRVRTGFCVPRDHARPLVLKSPLGQAASGPAVGICPRDHASVETLESQLETGKKFSEEKKKQ